MQRQTRLHSKESDMNPKSGCPQLYSQLPQKFNAQVNLSLRLSKYYYMKVYGGVEA